MAKNLLLILMVSCSVVFAKTDDRPIQMVWFTASNLNNRVALSWKTWRESGASKSFVIQISLNGKAFTDVSTVPVIGAGSNVYNAVDSPSSGYYFYRLKLLDMDGYFDYSDIETVSVKQDLKVFVSGSFLNIDEANGLAGIYSETGECLVSMQVNRFAAIDISRWPRGVYFVKIRDIIIKFFK